MFSKPAANLAQLPAELLVEILSCIIAPVDYDSPNYVENAAATNLADIKSLRLTCRKFVELANPALFSIASVSIFEPQSIEALEDLSTHPVLSRHVKAVRVHLGFYDTLLARNVESLAQYLSCVWSDFVLSAHSPSPTESAVVKLVRSRIDPKSGVQILARIQADYRSRYDRQQQAHESGDAVRRIAHAMSQMPTATRLVVDDCPHRSRHLGALLASVLGSDSIEESRLSQLVMPLSWIDCWRLKIDFVYIPKLPDLSHQFHLVIDLPVAIHRAGVRLTAFRVLGLQIPEDVPGWGTVDPGSLQEACQSLQMLEVTPQYRNEYCNLLTRQVFNPWSMTFNFTGRQQIPFSQVVDQMCMPNLNLRHLHIDCTSMEFYDDNDPDSHTCNHLFKSSRWPNLETLYVENARTNEACIVLDMIRDLPNLYEVHLDGLSFPCFRPSRDRPLQEGWADMLDSLRDQVRHLRENHIKRWGKKNGPELPIKVRNATLFWEAPADDGTPPELQLTVDGFFNDEGDGGFSKVDNYIRGAVDINPLVEARDRGILDDW
ncbi:hypothetical protein PspLS_09402 [Pyricularia sp. CBS 133598]|nr:hypothetical protein PspLS_09402 [Pyricularia sp. CBS 133598]